MADPSQPNSIALALQHLIDKDAMRQAFTRLTSLDTPKDQTMQETAADIGAGFVPVVGQMQAGRDFVRSYREKDPLGMGLSAAGMVPVLGGFAKVSKAKQLAKGLEEIGQTRINKFDPRFDLRVKEQEKLQSLVPQVESRQMSLPPEISIADLEGRPFITSMSDRTAAGGLLTGINDVQVDLYPVKNRKDTLNLARLVVDPEKRKQGLGSKAMQEIIDSADAGGKTITLSPSTDFGATSVTRLKNFYKRFGFVENKGRNKDFTISESMYRVPQSLENE